jgi:inosose dehydratase
MPQTSFEVGVDVIRKGTTVRVACHTITWGEPNLEDALREIHDLGFHAFETFASVSQTYANRHDAFRQLLRETQLDLISLYGGGDMHIASAAAGVIEKNVDIARFLSAFGANRMVLGPARRNQTAPTEAELRQLAATANEIGRQTSELGVLACLHPHVYTVVESIAEIDFVMGLLDHDVVGLAADTAHFAKGNADVPGAETILFRRYAEQIKYVHLKDWDANLPPDFDEHSLTPVIRDFTELGQGNVDLRGCVDILRGVGYDGWLTIELDYTRKTPRESVQISKDYLESALGLTA